MSRVADGRVFRFCIDRGGTFTDVYCEWLCEDGSRQCRVHKLLSEDPDRYPDAPREGIRRMLEQVTGVAHPREEPIPTERLEFIRMGTTVATNALLERKGEPTALLVTKGFRDVLHIGNQSRADIFDLSMANMHHNLYDVVMEVEERLIPQKVPFGAAGDPQPAAAEAPTLLPGTTGEPYIVDTPLDLEAARMQLQAAYDRGIRSVAVVLMHAYACPAHEEALGRLAREIGMEQVSLSHEVMPMVRAVARGHTTVVDAYLTPHIVKYLRSFQAGFGAGLDKVSLLFMQSSGGLAPLNSFTGHKAILSGPAGGVVGYAATAFCPGAQTGDDNDGDGKEGAGRPVVGFDMGGTSTDCSRFGGTLELVHEAKTAGVPIQSPQLDISTVAAGGGSRLFFRNGLFVVGPESAGAHPGPVCYRKGGHLAVTDANVVLGRVQPEFFPKIFGEGENEPLDAGASAAAMAEVLQRVREWAEEAGDASWEERGPADVALGFVEVANEAMARPIRELTQMKGFDVTTHTLACFGGAGGQHACAIARSLGISKIKVHRYAGILSAFGIGLADVTRDAQAPLQRVLCDAAGLRAEAAGRAATTLARLAQEASDRLQAELQVGGDRIDPAAGGAQMRVELRLSLRYAGTDTTMTTPVMPMASAGEEGAGGSRAGSVSRVGVGCSVPLQAAADADAVAACLPAVVESFLATHQREYGFVLPGRDVLVDNAEVTVRLQLPTVSEQPIATSPDAAPPAPVTTAGVWFRNHASGQAERLDTPIYQLGDLLAGHRVRGPAVVVDRTSTVLVEPCCEALVTVTGNLEIDVLPFDDGAAAASAAAGDEVVVDPVQLSVMGHRFMGIAEQMGRTLQRTSISVNIKERLDFSCALFGPDGGLVANAPHIPVHLGAMQEAVRFQLRFWTGSGDRSAVQGVEGYGSGLCEGDVLVSNHPQLAGGSHLPDITVITPVFAGPPEYRHIVFFVASRGHHADIGGITPGSMPPHSKALVEEGAAIVAFKLVKQGQFQDEGIRELLAASRNLDDCLSDLQAQIAANQRGITLVQELIRERGLRFVQSYMTFIQDAAAACVRSALRRFAARRQEEEALRTEAALGPELTSPAFGGDTRRNWTGAEDLQRADATGQRHWSPTPASAATPTGAGAEGAPGRPRPGAEGCETVVAEDAMDDGTPIRLALTVDCNTGEALFDFSGTGPEVFANTNAPPAVTYSAVIYALRCLVAEDIPLNQGCLRPVHLCVPSGSILNPSPTAAVVGGNVLTSQRVVDVVLRALGAAAASQGCMNNLTFGRDGAFGYYETIAGGAGAGPTWHGRSGVHTHMTNTRIGDVEVIERRYPVVVRKFSLRDGSGGSGRWRGGDGVVRELEFRSALRVSILSERRSLQPFGLAGGHGGSSGVNLLLRAGQSVVNLGGKSSVEVSAGDRLRLLTPGGGGYGAPPAAGHDEEAEAC